MHPARWGCLILAAALSGCTADRTRADTGPGPQNVLVLYNPASVDSEALARYYLRTRNIPVQQLLAIHVDRDAYALTIEQYHDQVLEPIRLHLEKSGLTDRIRCVVLMPDIPRGVEAGGTGHFQYVALDSLLASREPKVRAMAINPYSLVSQRTGMSVVEEFTTDVQKRCGGMLLVSRLDGPGLLTVKWMLDSAEKGEELGRAGKPFQGTFYIDEHVHGSATLDQYNSNLERCAQIGLETGNPVVVERTAARMTRFDAGPAIFYVGWYTLDKAINRGQDRWAPGAVAMEIHSESAWTLHSADAPQDWRNSYAAFFIRHGVAGTLGAFREPYLQTFPKPDELLTALRSGLTWAESFWGTLPRYQWQVLMLGDPLYRPFPKKEPRAPDAE